MAAPSDFPKLICELFKIDSLTQNQKDAIEALMQGKDVFVGTRTGSGKSLTYECIPITRCHVYVFQSHMLSMRDQ